MLNRDKLIQYSIDREEKQKLFLKGLIVHNPHTFTSKEIFYDLVDKYRRDYYFFKSVFTYFDREYTDYIKVFATITLPSFYHKNKTKENLKEGYDKVNQMLRKFLRYLGSYKIKVKYVKVVEKHKSLVPHFHILFYINNSNSDLTYATIRNLFYRYKRQFALGRSQFLRLKGEKAVQKYISKYIQKSLNPEKIDEIYFLDGWKRYLGIRLFTYSKVPLPKYVFLKLLNHIQDQEIDFDKYDDYYHYFLENTNVEYFYKGRKIREFGDKEKKYYVKVIFDDRRVFRGLVPFFDKSKIYSDLDYVKKFTDEIGKDYKEYIYYVNIHGYEIDFFDYNSFYSDLLDYYISLDDYRFVKDLEIWVDGDLRYKKTDIILERDLRNKSFLSAGEVIA